MKIRKRILISSACMVFLSLLALLIVGGWVIHSFSEPEINTDRLRIDSSLFEINDMISSIDEVTDNFEEIQSLYAEYGYDLLVLSDYQILKQSDKPIIPAYLKLFTDIKWTEETQSFATEEYFFAGRIIQDKAIIVYKRAYDTGTYNKFEKMLINFLTMGALAILIIVIAGLIFTNYLAKRILDPITSLRKGAKRIEDGNLSEPVVYKGSDEFAEVCDAFNHMQLHLKEEQEKNLAYEKARVDLVAGISHDLRTPLTSIKGYVKGLSDGVANTKEKQEQYLSIAYQKACDMEVLLQQLFYFSGMETGNLPIYLEDVDLRDFVDRFVQDYAKEMKQKNVEIQVNSGNAPLPAMIDLIQMNRVLFNLFENVLKYAKTDKIKIVITMRQEGKLIRLVFRDNGRGVEPDKLQYLFDRFWRGDESRSSKNGEGSGLGLYIVKYIIEAHGGSVEAHNDEGLCIKITIPYKWEKEEIYE